MFHVKHTDDLEQEPTAAVAVFRDSIETVRQFTDDLARRGEELGLIGPLELPRLWTRHVLNSGLVAPLIHPGALVGDIGSGAGLPGLVLAIMRPDARFVLIEPMERRTDWLRAEAQSLGLDNVDVARNAYVRNAILDKNVRVETGAEVGVDHDRDRERGYSISEGGIVIVPKGTVVTA